MRFTRLFSLALLAFAHSLAPGVHGAPAVSDNAPVVRRDLAADITSVLTPILGLLGGGLSPQTIQQIVQQALQELQGSPASGLLPRALSSSLPTFTTFSSSQSSSTTSVGLSSPTGNTSSLSLSTPQASSTRPPLLPLSGDVPSPSRSATTNTSSSQA